jgi:two-component system, chemotaxis family, sensor kinase CheA
MAGITLDSGFDEIRQIFVAECADGLDVIESGLLELEKGNNTQETINDIFRGAHSIKGGAATFGYKNIADFTHILETLLDRLREEELAITPPLVKLFLESVDCLREMVENMEGDGSYDEERANMLKVRLNSYLQKDQQHPAAEHTVAAVVTPGPEAAATGMATAIWDIAFIPKPDFLKNGNQPQHIFRALAELGKVTLKTDYSRLPEFNFYEPGEIYLAWDIELESATSKEHIGDVFDWVEMDAEIRITQRETLAVTSAEETMQTGIEVRNEDVGEKKKDKKNSKKESSSIRVDIEKIDVLLNLVGEMVINQSMLNQLARNKQGANNSVELEQALALLERTTRELQEAVMEIRMLPVSVTFSRFPRLVHDLSAKLKKNVELKITGEQTELDKTVLEKISDPLLHLIRNSLDHGIESPSERLRKGKPEMGVIHLSASHEGGSVVIRVTDDGGGLNADKIMKKAIEKGLLENETKLTDAQIYDLIFLPGFSTADTVTDVSGRGVGMDVVRSNIEDIGGRVEVYSEKDKGSTFQITLPLTLAILDGQLIKVGNEVYVLPLLSIVETVQVKLDRLNIISGRQVVYRLRGEAIPVVDMRRLYRIAGNEPLTSYANKQLIIVESERKSIGLVVDELLDQHQVVIKSLENNFVKVPGMLGATILGDGTVSLILDVTTLADTISKDLSQVVKH